MSRTCRSWSGPRYHLLVCAAYVHYRIALFFTAVTVSGAFSGLLAWGISFMSGTAGRSGWSWIFILEGSGTICVGIIAFFAMVDFPSTAKFLTTEEKDYVIRTKKYDTSSVGEEEHFEIRHIFMAVTDWQSWLHVLLNWSLTGSANGISLFLPSIIQGFGHSVAVTNLLTIPPYAVATIVLLLFAHFSDKLRLRWPFVLAGLVSCVVGFGINISNTSNGVKYFGTFLCVAGSHSSIPGAIAWLGGNVAGQYKRAVALALFVSIGNTSGIVVSNIYRTQDAPKYKLGHGIELGIVGMGIIVVLTLAITYRLINARREAIVKKAGESGGLQYSDEELRKMGDKAPNFRYGI